MPDYQQFTGERLVHFHQTLFGKVLIFSEIAVALCFSY